MYICRICGQQTADDDRWLVLAENRWRDRIAIFRFERSLALEPGMQTVCGAAHARELVVHWMTTGTLSYPFARTPSFAETDCRGAQEQGHVSIMAGNNHGARTLGELAVHRESLQRVLAENPQALNSVLNTLVSAVESAVRTKRPNLERMPGECSAAAHSM